MSQDTRQMSNRATVADMLVKASKEIAKIAEGTERVLSYLKAAQAIIHEADGLANAQPRPGAKKLPSPIRRRVLTAAKTLERLADEIRKVPVTRDERIIVEAHKQRERRKKDEEVHGAVRRDPVGRGGGRGLGRGTGKVRPHRG